MLRHALWNVNTEHGNTIMKISGSPICAYGHDFNPCILDERGNFVFFGPFLQYLSAAVGNAVKWTLENRSENPGIADGDMWLCNDPWIGATHQNDVAVMAPVFHEGELFCWVANTLHQWDLGGTAPGGFNPFAQDVFWEPPCIPPVKIVEGDVIRIDVEEMYLRSSRMPDLVRAGPARRGHRLPHRPQPHPRDDRAAMAPGPSRRRCASSRTTPRPPSCAAWTRSRTAPGPRRAGWRSPCPATAASTRTASP